MKLLDGVASRVICSEAILLERQKKNRVQKRFQLKIINGFGKTHKKRILFCVFYLVNEEWRRDEYPIVYGGDNCKSDWRRIRSGVADMNNGSIVHV
ncbi:MAG: hypothetical protein K2Y28_06155 [Burkholderiaceae bacterium]|nr:hypothetical protein [Burkholderiaceae bacterium]